MSELELSNIESLHPGVVITDSGNRIISATTISSIQRVETTKYDFVITDANDRIIYGHSPLSSILTSSRQDFALEAIISRGIAKACASIDTLRADKILRPVISD